MNFRDQRGFFAPFALILLYSVSSQVFTLALAEQHWLACLKRKQTAVLEEELLWEQASRFIDTFLAAGGEHPTPQMLEELPGYSYRTGSRFYFQTLTGVTLSLEELSSRFNPNFDCIGFWKTPALADRISSPGALLRWETDRRESGKIEDPKDLEWLFPREDWDDLYSLYGSFAAGGQGGWNIHFMTPLMKEAVAWYPWAGREFENPGLIFHELTDLCQVGPVTGEEIAWVLRGETPECRNAFLMQIGTRSWFWKIRVFSGSAGLELVVRFVSREEASLIPDNSQKARPESRGYQLVSWIKTGGEI